MIAAPGMLVAAAEKAKIKVPPDPDRFVELMNQYPHFYAFCMTQLCRSWNYPGEHWDNAQVIASIPEEEILNKSIKDLKEVGLSYPDI